MNPASDLVNKLWRLCALLRKDGITYQQYVTELTYLLFLKMASEQKDESRIPEQYRWRAITAANEAEVLQVYRQALVDLGNPDKVSDRSVVAIFQNATTVVREPATLRKLIDAIDGLHWFSDERDAFGDAAEDGIARFVAVNIVDRLEAVDIDKQQRRGQRPLARLIEQRGNGIDEAPPVEQSGKRVATAPAKLRRPAPPASTRRPRIRPRHRPDG